MMTHTTTYNHTTRHSARHHVALLTTYILFLLCIPATATAQIRIGGNVYGGGNQGDLGGNTKVELRGGDIEGSVYGGARMADVDGHAYVHINGAEATEALVVKGVYGGNDIAGTVGTGADTPFEVAAESGVDATWNAFVQATAQTEGHLYPMIIGELYGGGNGDYQYLEAGNVIQVYNRSGNVVATIDAAKGVQLPTLAKTYLHLGGGVFGHIYGGGNAVCYRMSSGVSPKCVILWRHFRNNGVYISNRLWQTSVRNR